MSANAFGPGSPELSEEKPVQATLVIPDVHNAFGRAEAIIKSLAGRYERVVFLGDYFDDFGDTPSTVRAVADWLRHSVGQPNRVHLMGNHDLAYFAPGPYTRCSGFEHEKMRAIAPVLNLLPRGNLRAAFEADGWLLSHAGFHPRHINGRTAEELVNWSDTILRQLFAGGRPTLFAAGAARGGPEPVGGVSWCDWEQEFVPTDGIHQIVGHTPAAKVRIASIDRAGAPAIRRAELAPDHAEVEITRHDSSSMNICLDTRLRYVALLNKERAMVVPT